VQLELTVSGDAQFALDLDAANDGTLGGSDHAVMISLKDVAPSINWNKGQVEISGLSAAATVYWKVRMLVWTK
jgi:hypothetical protein